MFYGIMAVIFWLLLIFASGATFLSGLGLGGAVVFLLMAIQKKIDTRKDK